MQEAQQLLDAMINEGLRPNVVIYTMLLSAHARRGMFAHIHIYLVYIKNIDMHIVNTYVDLYILYTHRSI